MHFFIHFFIEQVKTSDLFVVAKNGNTEHVKGGAIRILKQKNVGRLVFLFFTVVLSSKYILIIFILDSIGTKQLKFYLVANDKFSMNNIICVIIFK